MVAAIEFISAEMRILTGTPPDQAASRDNLANPAALDWFAKLARSR